ncbi:hypothetical protein EVAR_25349_1 [Eumeta japonica]|uniref:Uncharacterized protein n=1 Tax=Eumeta variegata TaxID=151549 RepID=A0A4C1XXU7_EUMVA|nr:hypothetical protein EVAR_25349_1 [Eumeta japonica]
MDKLIFRVQDAPNMVGIRRREPVKVNIRPTTINPFEIMRSKNRINSGRDPDTLSARQESDKRIYSRVYCSLSDRAVHKRARARAPPAVLGTRHFGIPNSSMTLHSCEPGPAGSVGLRRGAGAATSRSRGAVPRARPGLVNLNRSASALPPFWEGRSESETLEQKGDNGAFGHIARGLMPAARPRRDAPVIHDGIICGWKDYILIWLEWTGYLEKIHDELETYSNDNFYPLFFPLTRCGLMTVDDCRRRGGDDRRRRRCDALSEAQS